MELHSSASNLSPDNHIDAISSTALRVLGLLIRTAKHGLSVETMTCIYNSLVRSILEYGRVVWSPYQLKQIQCPQRIQDRFLRVVGVKLVMNTTTLHWNIWRKHLISTPSPREDSCTNSCFSVEYSLVRWIATSCRAKLTLATRGANPGQFLKSKVGFP